MVGIFQNQKINDFVMNKLLDRHWNRVKTTIKKLQLKAHEKKTLFELLDDVCGPKYSFHDIVTADFDTLVGLMSDNDFVGNGNNFYKSGLITRNYIKAIAAAPNEQAKKTIINTYNHANDSSTQIMINIYNNFRNNYGTDYVNDLNLTICPYCNRDYICSDTNTLAELDHFFDKSDCPLLAVSLFNLVPCCHSCNHNKSTKHAYEKGVCAVSPFEKSATTDKLVHFNVKTSFENGRIRAKNINLECLEPYRKRMRKNEDMFQIESRYKPHLDIVDDLIVKNDMYNSLLLSSFNNMFSDNGVAGPFSKKEIFYGAGLSEEHYHLRPLSKFTKDVVDWIEENNTNI